MFQRIKIDDYSPLFRGVLTSPHRLRIIDRGGASFLIINGGEVEGSRQVLERVREGILKNGGPQRITEHTNI